MNKGMIVVIILTLAAYAAVTGFSVGTHYASVDPLKYTTRVDFEKVIGWCMYAGMEEALGAGMTEAQTKELLPLMREECENRWLRFSKNWERDEDE